MESRLCTLAVPARDVAGHYVAGINVILQGRWVDRTEMAERSATLPGTRFASASLIKWGRRRMSLRNGFGYHRTILWHGFAVERRTQSASTAEDEDLL